jgi:Flp pilus assembly protein TadD
MENGNLPAASMISDIRLQSIPDDSEVLWDSAIIYAKLTRFDAARKQLEKILISGAPEIKVLTLLARICIHQNDPTSAETHINQLLEIDPSNSEALSLKESLDQNTQPKQ